MSGRSFTTLQDGRRVQGFRKTLRRNPRKDPAERRQEIARAGLDASIRNAQVSMCFRLPQSLEGFVAQGDHGIGVKVLRGAFVRVTGISCDHCCTLAREFLGIVAKERPGFTVTASITALAEPNGSHGRYLTVTKGSVVVSAGLHEPRLFEAA